MNREKPFWKIIALALLPLAIGCGNPSGETEDSSRPASVTHPAHVSGVATKGKLKFSRISIFRLNPDFTVGDFVGTALTDANGNYDVTLNLPSVGSALVIYAQGGTYVNPLSGEDVPLTGVLRGMTASDGDQVFSLSPLSHLAAARAHFHWGQGLSLPQAIDRADQDVAKVMGVGLGTLKALPEAANAVVPEDVPQNLAARFFNSGSDGLGPVGAPGQQEGNPARPAVSPDQNEAKLLLDGLDMVMAQAAADQGSEDLLPIVTGATLDFETDQCLNEKDDTGDTIGDSINLSHLQSAMALLKAQDKVGEYARATGVMMSARGLKSLCSKSGPVGGS